MEPSINQIKDNIDEASAAQALAHKLQGPKQSRSRAYYRVQATRMLTAGSKLDGNSAAKRVRQILYASYHVIAFSTQFIIHPRKSYLYHVVESQSLFHKLTVY